MQSQKDKGDRRESAAHIKKLVAFNSLVVTPLVERLSGRDAAMKEMAELLAKAAEEAKKEGGSEEEIAAKVEKVREDTVKEVQKAIQVRGGAQAQGPGGHRQGDAIQVSVYGGGRKHQPCTFHAQYTGKSIR